MSEHLSSQPNQNDQLVSLEAIPTEYRVAILAAIEQQAPLPYEDTDIEGDEDDADRMRGYNEGRNEVLEVIRKVLGAA